MALNRAELLFGIRERFQQLKGTLLVREGTLSEFEWCMYQQSVHHVSDLTDEGMEFYRLVEQAVHLGCGQLFGRAKLLGDDSGFWSPNKESPFYSESTHGNGFFTSKNNRVLRALEPLPDSAGKFVQTSCVIFSGSNWVFTKSGSLYVYEP